MKTAKEWMNQLSGLYNPAHVTVNHMVIRKIQLNAMKEGMRKAAKILDPIDVEPISSMEKAIKSAYNAILTAVERLTEEDL